MDPNEDKGCGCGCTGCDEEAPAVLEEIEVEDLAVDGICGVY
jgi:mycofactocin precursor